MQRRKGGKAQSLKRILLCVLAPFASLREITLMAIERYDSQWQRSTK